MRDTSVLTELHRALAECQRQIREMDDRERRDNELRQMAEEEFSRAEALSDRLVTLECKILEGEEDRATLRARVAELEDALRTADVVLRRAIAT